jgi:hypothetical protein
MHAMRWQKPKVGTLALNIYTITSRVQPGVLRRGKCNYSDFHTIGTADGLQKGGEVAAAPLVPIMTVTTLGCLVAGSSPFCSRHRSCSTLSPGTT